MTSDLHNNLCQVASGFLTKNGFSVAFDDRFRAISSAGEQPDTLGFRNLTSCLIEVKVSRSDFLADVKKPFRIEPSLGMGDWRFFLSPPGVIDPNELPSGWGLLYCDGKGKRPRVTKIHGWPGNTQWVNEKPFSANKQAEVDYLYGALRRVKAAGILDVVYNK